VTQLVEVRTLSSRASVSVDAFVCSLNDKKTQVVIDYRIRDQPKSPHGLGRYYCVVSISRLADDAASRVLVLAGGWMAAFGRTMAHVPTLAGDHRRRNQQCRLQSCCFRAFVYLELVAEGDVSAAFWRYFRGCEWIV